ncbi:DUF779 domain-containing protein [Kaistia dalseonensis]|uniref:Uncharacterized protein (DUF779 family) n=1 Tax=Kaistia dalseonensis TaxID=410840 RepID=A0ABU0H791_9HYPH|nr:DUF779 domain-containing protein [Kaistia dalseonensis]MCX5495577.1 DUF779 domain-containing protein [Kaistia dalseonensis]MDQ0438169.1 uncharacterized protein (DUF779 family) [Kaistia dalseonensis]
MTPAVPRVTVTPAALDLLHVLRAEHGDILFHQSGGCCDGSSPMCFRKDEFIIGDEDIRLGEIGGAPFYMSPSQFDYWKHTQLIIDVVPGRGGMFSLENGREVRFLTRSRLFDDAELPNLTPIERFGTPALAER